MGRMGVSAYYNENDPAAAAWPRELIKAGEIADGVVDGRGIEEVTAHDVRGFTQCHFFAGIGAWSLALRRGGWDDDRPVWTASLPCQPFSAAGKREGVEDRRHLWPVFFRLMLAGKCPSVPVLGEQVSGRGGLEWFDLVSIDLENAGYAVGVVDTCAAGFGAPHLRQRLYWLADAGGVGRQRRRAGEESGRDALPAAERRGDAGGVDHAPEPRHDGARERDGGSPLLAARPEQPGAAGGLADADEGKRGRFADGEGRDRDRQAAGRDEGDGEPEPRRDAGGLADAHSERCDRGTAAGQFTRPGAGSGGGGDAGHRPGPVNGHWRDADWIFCRDNKWRPVEPGTFPLVTGAAARVGRLRGYGNSLCVPQAEAFVRAAIDALW